MSAVNQPYVTASLVPDASLASLAQPRILIVGAAYLPLLSFDVTLYQKSAQSSFELASDAEIIDLFGAGQIFERWKAAKAGSAGLVPIDFLIVNTFDLEPNP